MCDELIKELRQHHCNAKEDDTQEVCEECAYDVIIADKSVPSGIASVCVCGLMNRAADAIEELQKITTHYEEESKGWWLAACDAKEERERLKEQIPKWIPVTERLPEYDQKVLVFSVYTMYVYKFCVPDERCGAIGNHWQDDYGVAQAIEEGQFWMPLPQPPESGEA